MTKLVWLETPSNPLWGVSDIEGAARIAHAAGAALAVDSTCATPVFTRPLALGADVVMHSATKYLNGHSDVLAGALGFARDDALCLSRAPDPAGAWPHPASVRGVSADARLENPRPARAGLRRQRDGAREPPIQPRFCLRRAVSGAAAASRPRARAAADAGRIRGYAVDPRSRRRRGGDRGGCAGERVEAGDFARRRRVSDRTPRLDRRARLALPARPLAAFGGKSRMSKTCGAISIAPSRDRRRLLPPFTESG